MSEPQSKSQERRLAVQRDTLSRERLAAAEKCAIYEEALGKIAAGRAFDPLEGCDPDVGEEGIARIMCGYCYTGAPEFYADIEHDEDCAAALAADALARAQGGKP